MLKNIVILLSGILIGSFGMFLHTKDHVISEIEIEPANKNVFSDNVSENSYDNYSQADTLKNTSGDSGDLTSEENADGIVNMRVGLRDYLDTKSYETLNKLFLGVLNDLNEIPIEILLQNGFPTSEQTSLLLESNTSEIVDGVIKESPWMDDKKNHLFHSHAFAKSLYELERTIKYYRPEYELGDPILLKGQSLGDGSIPEDIEVALRSAREASITVYGPEAFTQLTLAKASLMNIYSFDPNRSSDELQTLKAISYLSNANERIPQINVESVLQKLGKNEELYPIYLAVHVTR